MDTSAFRRAVLKVLLWSLALGAAAGVLAVLLATGDIVARVVGTLLLTAGAAALMLPLSYLLDRKRTAQAGLVGLAVVVADYLISVGLVWELFDAVGYSRLEERSFQTLWWLFSSGAAAMVCLWLRGARTGRWAGWAGLGLTAVFFGLGMIGTWYTRGFWDGSDWWETAVAVAAFGPLAVASLVGVGSDRYHWRWLGVICDGIAALMMIVGIWSEAPENVELWSVFVTLGVLVAYANLVVRVPLAAGQRWLRPATVGAAIAAGLLIEAAIWTDLDQGDRLIERMAGAAVILTGAGALALLVLARLNRRVDYEAINHDFVDIKLTCPRCRTAQRLGLDGPGQCSACGLRIEVRIEEPACAHCGYLLVGATGESCPECGKPIAAPAVEQRPGG